MSLRSAVRAPPQIAAESFLELDQGDKVRPPLPRQQGQHGALLQVRVPRDLPDRLARQGALQASGDLLRDRGWTVDLAMGPMPGDQLVPRCSDNAAAGWHLTTTLRGTSRLAVEALTWSFIRTILTEHQFVQVGWLIMKGEGR